MRILSFLPAVVLVLTISFSTACERDDEVVDKKPPQAYLDLLQAYDLSRIYVSALQQSTGCVVSFADGFSINVPETAFGIHDCIETQPLEVSASSGWWKVGDVVRPIKVETAKSKEESWPVYVYYDSYTLHMHISNGQHLVFESDALSDAEEIKRRQNIPVMKIRTEGGAGIYDKENYVPGTITVYDPEKLYSDVTEFTAAMGIRGRGNSTWSFPKKPWKVKLDSKASILGLPADKEWCLLANYADRTLLRNVVAMELSKLCGFSWTPRMVSVEVYLNDAYQGVYTFCEHKKISSDRVDLNVDAGDVYLEIEQQQDETTCWWTGMGVPMMFSDPEVPSPELFVYVRQYFQDFESSLYSGDIGDPELGYAAYIDVDSFIDYFIVQELTKNTDGNLRKSTFITKKKDSKLEMYHLWDFDLTLGNNGGFLHEPEGFWVKDYAPGCVLGDNWYNRMFTDPAFAHKVRERWNELMPQLRTIPEFIDLQALYLEKAQERNFKVWSIWESVDWVNCPSLGSYEKEIDFLKEFYVERLEWLDRELNKL